MELGVGECLAGSGECLSPCPRETSSEAPAPRLSREPETGEGHLHHTNTNNTNNNNKNNNSNSNIAGPLPADEAAGPLSPAVPGSSAQQQQPDAAAEAVSSSRQQQQRISCQAAETLIGAAAAEQASLVLTPNSHGLAAASAAAAAAAHEQQLTREGAAAAAAAATRRSHQELSSSADTSSSSWQQQPQQQSAGPQMVKSVSPAGVIRIGGRNRRKRTKYDLAYKQMEELGPFEEEAKSVDVSKVSGNSFALELLRNPQQYSYDSWVYGFAWPVGADGRRLLLRKLRGVYWSDPERWQRVLQENNLYRRDLFTLATVQELFKVTHLMGAEVWDFLLKCTALTQKCGALSSKDADIGEDEALEALGAPQQRPSELHGVEASKSEDELHGASCQLLSAGVGGGGASYGGSSLSRIKRFSSEGSEEREAVKRSRGRPRKSPFRARARLSASAEAVADSSPAARHHKTAAAAVAAGLGSPPGWSSSAGDASFELPSHGSLAEASPFFDGPQHRRRSRGEGQQQQQHASSAWNSEDRQRLLASLLQATSPPPPGGDCCCRSPAASKALLLGAPEGEGLGGPQEEVGGGPNPSRSRSRTNGNLLKLTAHYTFMAQFMQCCMLVEVQRTLLRLAEEFRPSDAASCCEDTPNGEAATEKRGPGGEEGTAAAAAAAAAALEAKDADPTAQACFDSLMQSSNIHMDFVQVIVQQLRSQARSPCFPEADNQQQQQQQQPALQLGRELEDILQQLQVGSGSHQ